MGIEHFDDKKTRIFSSSGFYVISEARTELLTIREESESV